jgi:hypothetical protein
MRAMKDNLATPLLIQWGEKEKGRQRLPVLAQRTVAAPLVERAHLGIAKVTQEK